LLLQSASPIDTDAAVEVGNIIPATSNFLPPLRKNQSQLSFGNPAFGDRSDAA
jgi:hypothetical protein